MQELFDNLEVATETPPVADPGPVRVSQLATKIGRHLRDFGEGVVEGEIQKINRAASGHVYLTLGDDGASLEAAIWKGRAQKIGPLPPVGSLVQAHYDKIGFAIKNGRLSLHVDSLRLTGEGEMLTRKAEILGRLRDDGLCDPDRRRALPTLPRRVAIISGRGSDARADVETALRTRFPAVNIVHRAALVQGSGAVGSIIDALAHLQDQDGVDVIILARGGGSVADLHPFDDERLCRAIFACRVPVVTSIGHTQQRPNCDHVAAVSAHVPAKTAELVVPSSREMLSALDRAEQTVRRAAARVSAHRDAVEQFATRLRGVAHLRQHAVELDTAADRLSRASQTAAADRHASLDTAADRLRNAGRRALDRELNATHADDRRLSQTLADLPTVSDVDPAADRIAAAVRRARSNLHDAQIDLERVDAQRHRNADRRLAGERDQLSGPAQRVGVAGRRALAASMRDVEHAEALLEAKDPRRHGFALITGPEGQILRGVAGMRSGDSLTLAFTDGTAEATVTTVNPDTDIT